MKQLLLILSFSFVLFSCGGDPSVEKVNELLLESLERGNVALYPVAEEGGQQIPLTFEDWYSGESVEVLGIDVLEASHFGLLEFQESKFQGNSALYDEDKEYILLFETTDEGEELLYSITSKYVNRELAMVVEGKVVFQARVMEGISGGRLQASGINHQEFLKYLESL